MVLGEKEKVLCIAVNHSIFLKMYHFVFHFMSSLVTWDVVILVQWNLDLGKPDLRKNLDLRKIVGTTNFLKDV